MFDGLEGDDKVDAGIGERQRRACALDVAHVRPVAVACPRVIDGLIVAVDANDRFGGGAEEPASVPLPACRIEYALAASGGEHRAVAMPVFVPDRTLLLGGEAFAGERKGRSQEGRK